MVVKERTVSEGYKMTELGEIPVEWEIKTTGELFDNVSKKGFEDLPVLSVTQENGVVYRDELDINIKYDKSSLKNYKLIDQGQFVISLRSFQGGIEYSDKKGISSPAYTVLQPKETVYQDYFKYLFKSFWFIDKLKGSIIGIRDGKQISYSDFKIIKLAVPPKDQQQKIAGILSTVDEQIENTDQLITKTKELKKGLMQQLMTKGIGHIKFKKTELGEVPVGWEVKELIDISEGKGEYGIGASAIDYSIEKPRYLRITDIDENGRLSKNDVKGFDAENYEKYILSEGDILFARTGNTTGKSYLYRKNDGDLVFAGFLIRFSINKKIADAEYIFYYVQTKKYWDWVKKMSARSGQPGINSNQYANLLIPYPSIKEQQKIAEILSTVDEDIESYEQEKEKYMELKKGLMQQLLTGKIRVTV